MSAKPGSAPPPKKGGASKSTSDKATGSKARPKTEAKEAKGQGKSKPKEKPGEDDPFEIDQTAALKAVKASPKPVKGRLHKVTCPMCETVGFIPKKAVGRDIRCANKDCMVPVFKAEKKKPKGDPRVTAALPVEESSARSPLMVYGGVAALVIATGIGVLFLVKDDGKPTDFDKPFPGGFTKKVDEYDPTAPVKKKAVETVVEKVDYVAMRTATIDDMVGAARDAARTRKPYCRRLTSEAYAIAGDFKSAGKELDQLVRNDRGLGYYRIQPWSRIAIQNLRAGDAAGAKQSLDEALSVSAKLPGFGRTPIEMVTALASALVCANRDDDAVTLLKKHRRDRSIPANVSEELLSADIALKREIQAAGLPNSDGPDSQIWVDPQRTVVAGIVLLNGFTKRAIEWSLNQDDQTRADCIALCAELAVKQFEESGNRQNLDEIIASSGSHKTLVNSVAARCLSRSAEHSAMGKTLFTEAQTAFNAIPDVKQARSPDVSESLNYELPNSGSLRTSTLVGIELSCASARLAPDQSEAILNRTIMFPKAYAPPFGEAQKRVDEFTNNSNRIKAQLRRALNTSDDGLQRAARKYRDQWGMISKASATRRNLLANVVRRVSDAGLHAMVWETLPDMEEDDIMALDSVWHVVDAYNSAGDKTKMSETIAALSKDKRSLSPLGSLSRTLDLQLKNGKVKPAIATATSVKTTSVTDKSGAIIRAALNNTQEGQLANVLKFIKGLKYAPLREEALDLVIAEAQRFKDPAEVRTLIDDTNFSASDRCAAYHGLAIGLGRIIAADVTETPTGG